MFRRATVAGNSEQIVASLHEIREACPLPVEFVARSYFHTLEYTVQIELMEQLIEEVAPHV